MKAIHNILFPPITSLAVVLYLKDTEKWKQFTTTAVPPTVSSLLCCISKILKNESNSQHYIYYINKQLSCVVSQRYWKMKAIHNPPDNERGFEKVVLYLKDTEKWKQFTTSELKSFQFRKLCCISKILKNESNSQLYRYPPARGKRCVVSQRYWKMKAIHNKRRRGL